VKALVLQLTYTKLTANDLTHQDTTGPEPLIRRADYQIGFAAQYSFMGADAAFNIVHIGPRWDTGKTKLPPYTLVNLTLAYKVMFQTQIYIKLHNLLDEKYEEIKGYSTSRFAAYAGIKVELP